MWHEDSGIFFSSRKKKKNIEKKKFRVRKEFTSLFSLPHLG
jgi:hypothetical protein